MRSTKSAPKKLRLRKKSKAEANLRTGVALGAATGATMLGAQVALNRLRKNSKFAATEKQVAANAKKAAKKAAAIAKKSAKRLSKAAYKHRKKLFVLAAAAAYAKNGTYAIEWQDKKTKRIYCFGRGCKFLGYTYDHDKGVYINKWPA